MSAKFIIVAVILGASLLSTSAELEQPIRGANERKLQAPGGTFNANYGQSSNEAVPVWQWKLTYPAGSKASAKQMAKSSKQGTTGTYGRKLQQVLTGGNINANYGFSTGQLLLTRQWKIGQNGASYKAAPMVKSPSAKKSPGRKLMQAAGIPGDLKINYGFSTSELLQASTYRLDRTGSTFTSKQMAKTSKQGATGSIGGK